MSHCGLKLSHLLQLLCLLTGLCIGVSISYYLSLHELDSQAISLSSYYQAEPVMLVSPFPELPVVVESPPPDLSPPPPQLNETLLSESDRELFRQALTVSLELPDKVTIPKAAFMFLAKGQLHLAPLWNIFFRGHEGLYSIYVHSSPLYVDSSLEDSIFHGKRIPSQEVRWGTSSMIDAERRLLANALLDISNQRFILLSESCIPLYNFTTIYNSVMNSNLSFIQSLDDPRKTGRGRYNDLMFPTISIHQWRKGSQWFEVNRDIALEIVSDTKYYPVFVEHCQIPCYSDEHYIPTLINIVRPDLNSNRSITWVDWSKPGPHPGRFMRSDVSVELLDRIRFCENCTYGENNNLRSVCFLFARKFTPDTLQPLLQIVPSVLQGINSISK